ncbi:MAG: hypothetical protein COA79_14615 [Planctomycetota bacterium]|nr:MAG: hypothetical protein COA79_14615 [Planctomycetota bacterium]
MEIPFLSPHPQKIRSNNKTMKLPMNISVKSNISKDPQLIFLKNDLKQLGGVKILSSGGFQISLMKQKIKAKSEEAYTLEITSKGAKIKSNSNKGLFYGIQTFLQLFLLNEDGKIPLVLIEDCPQYNTRSFMIDLGRSTFSFEYIKRIIRILSRLKMNTLHIHLCDDQLGGLRFKKLPLGKENPYAITIAELKKIVTYARKYHVTIIPEVECWGHAGSMIYHYPELLGGPGMWGGASFAIGEKLYELFDKVFDELIPVLEKDCQIHVGLDEAIWILCKSIPEEKKKEYTPSTLVQRIYEILESKGKKYKKNIKMHLWADHGGRPIPKHIQDKVVVQPWMYFECREDDITEKIKRFSGKNKTPFLMGGGMSSRHYHGHFGATKIWCEKGMKSPNVEGVTICMWEGNDLSSHMAGLYGGANCAWNPKAPNLNYQKNDTYREKSYGLLEWYMRTWQQIFQDADTEAINEDRGPEVNRGFFCWGKNAGKEVAPTANLTFERDMTDAENMEQ